MPACNHYEDAELIERLQRDDEQSFVALYSRYEEKLANYVVQITRNKEDAADIVQEIFVSLWNRRKELEITYSVNAWLYQAARFQAAKYIRRHINKRIFQARMIMSLEVDDFDTPHALLENTELIHRLGEIVGAMPEKMKEVYLLSREERLSHRDISRKLGIAESTVKKQVQKALRFIKSRNLVDFMIFCFLFIRIFF